MNVKKYRATTTREALEQVKMDLGDDAFVLETRQVNTGGFFGLRSRKEIEISAASAEFAKNPEDFFKTTANKQSSGIALVDDSYAAPKRQPVAGVNSKEKIMNALAARAASAKNIEQIMPRVPRGLAQAATTSEKPIEVVEISSRAPQLVHQKSRVREEANPANNHRPEAMHAEITRDDLAQIRAELREVKFSLNAFSATAPRPLDDFDFERDGAVFDYPFYDSYLAISKTGLDPARIRKYLLDFVPQFSNGALPSANLSKLVLKKILGSSLNYFGDPLETNKCVAVIGATGVGKTTTIAKLAAKATLDDGKRVELVTLDTYRIAAVEQLKTYAEIIGAGCHVVRSVEHLDRVLEKIGDEATVLIDTTGRSPYDLSDQFEVSDYLRLNNNIHKCLAVQATLNTHDALAAFRKFEMYGTNSVAITKMDETARPGAFLETVAASQIPLSYFCMGQRVPEDIRTASAQTIADNLLPESAATLKMSA